MGLGFAIPIDRARDIAEQLISTGEAVHATLGVNARSVTDGTRDGALVVNVEPRRPAAEAGLREQDVIIAVDGMRVGSSEELAVAVDAHAPGRPGHRRVRPRRRRPRRSRRRSVGRDATPTPGRG